MTSHRPNDADPLRLEVYELADAALSGVITAAQTGRLHELVCNDAAARRHYVQFMHGSAVLRDWGCDEASGFRIQRRGLGTSVRGLGTSVPSTVASNQWPVASEPSSVHRSSFSIQHSSSPAPFIVFDPTLPSFLSPLPSSFSTTHPFLFSYLMATVIFGIAGLAGWLYKVEHYTEFAWQFDTSPAAVVEHQLPSASRMAPVARVTGLVDCLWSEPETEAFNGSHISPGRRFALSAGLMQLTYDTGAQVILQGPCSYEVESPTGGFLSLGKLTARVEKRGERRGERGEGTANRPSPDQPSVGARRGAGGEGGRNQSQPALTLALSRRERGPDSNPKSQILDPSPLSPLLSPLFSVRTPTAIVTDLGTEFGVEVSKDGQTTSHVFRGSIRLQVASVDGKAEGVAQVLHENESARVEPPGGKHDTSRLVVLVPTFAPSTFVREIPRQTIKALDLVDVVAGGDGFSGRRNRWIDPRSGRVSNTPPKESKEVKDFIVGDGKYHRVEALPLVDGVFIPDGRVGPVQIDSAGHAFAEFPNTSNLTDGYVWAGGAVPAKSSLTGLTVLGGVDYGASGHGHLFLHANKGVTFDLEAIRRANPGCKLVRFRAVVGNTETASAKGAAVYADAWVLVDAKMRFKVREISAYNGAIPINIPLDNNDRFLTLAATDGGNGIFYNWVLFGDPRLELQSEGSKGGDTTQN